MRCVLLSRLFLLLSMWVAYPHDAAMAWGYDIACCGGNDCAAVADGVVVKNRRPATSRFTADVPRA